MNTLEQNSRIMVGIEGPPQKGIVEGLPEDGVSVKGTAAWTLDDL
jgi:hypothetical protein